MGAVLLKRLEDARADGDHIYALIRGSATNNDGAQKASYTAPGVAGQTAVLLEAMACAGVDAESLSYIEAHGTATDLGDAIEMQALSDAFRAGTGREGFCAIGSVKTNIGHLETAAGVAGLIKTALALHHGEIPPSLHFTRANPKIDFARSPFYVNTELAPWPATDLPRRAGVSSFGIGSTNAHVILEEAPAVPARPITPAAQVLLLSARTATALEARTDDLAAHLERHPDLDLADVAFTLATGRRAFAHRRIVVCREGETAVDAARLLASREPSRVLTGEGEGVERPVVFLFPGLGEQAVEMGLGLYRKAPVFRAELDRCAELLRPSLGLDLRTVLYPHGTDARSAASTTPSTGDGVDLRRMLGRAVEPPDEEGEGGEAARRLAETRLSQPVLFAVEYALSRLFMSWGIKPRALLGYSLGEYVAACLAGVLSLPDALRLVAERARLIAGEPEGAMLAVPLGAAEAGPLLAAHGLSLAAENGPALTVAAGPVAAIAALERTLLERNLVCRRLLTDRAFHSEMMAPVADRLAELVGSMPLAAPQIPYLSNVTGRFITPEEAQDPGYWVRHLCGTVRFADGIAELLSGPERILLEVGPGQSLTSAVKQHPACGDAAARLAWPTLPNAYSRQDALESVLGTLGKLWLAGATPDWKALWAGQERRRVPLPTYPFERQRHWIDAAPAPAAPGTGAARQGRRVTLDKQPDMTDWFYLPVWRQAPSAVADTPAAGGEKAPWLLFVDADGVEESLGAALAERLRADGHPVVEVRAGTERSFEGDACVIRPGHPEDYDALLAASPAVAVHLWGLPPEASGPLSEETYERLQERGFYSLLFLAQALGRRSAGGRTRIVVVTSQVHRVTGRETLCPEKATVLGPCRVIPQEIPGLTCRQIDLDGERGEPVRIASRLLAEIGAEIAGAAPETDPVVALRGADLEERWVQDFEPARLTDAAAPRLRQGGVYLLTGGLGGVGLTLAEHLGRTLQARLVLTGRSPFPAREEWARFRAEHGEDHPVSGKIRRLEALETAGAEVLSASVDAADEAGMRAVVAAARQRFGALHGVFHLAGVPGGGILQLKSREAAERILSPKVRGARVLDAIFSGTGDMGGTGGAELDFLVLFSSIASILGEFGQADYCGANAFLDAFAQRNAARGGPATPPMPPMPPMPPTPPTIAVDWDIWREVGLAVHTEVPRELKAWREEMLEQAILPAEGVAALDRILSALPAQVVVSAQPLPGRIELGRSFTGDGFLRELAASRPAAASAPPSGGRRILGTGFAAAQGNVEHRIAELWQRILGVEQVGVHDNFFDLGGNSLLGLQLVSEINRELGSEIAPVTLFESPTVAALARHLEPARPERSERPGKATTAPTAHPANTDIAIIGMTGRFPGATNLDELWRLLRDGVEAVTFFSDEELLAAGVEPELIADPKYVRAGSILEGIDRFDAPLFGYSPREAEVMDPQHRFFLECAWEVLEQAGHDPGIYPGAIGVFAGSNLSTYLLQLYADPEVRRSVNLLQAILGNDKDSLTTSVSYKLNLRGPSVAVQTFCSTSLVAVHMACQSLRLGESDMALAGGVRIVVPDHQGYLYEVGGLAPSDGHTRSFDAAANGSVLGHGVAVVLLKRLADALADGDPIRAVIKGSAINNDGSLKAGYTAPSVTGQAAAVLAALDASGVAPESIGYVEAHGSATELGDPIEITALTKAYRARTERTGFCRIGSLKSNFGHLDRAAGAAGLIKAVLALEKGEIPPSINFETPNPKIDFAASPFQVNTELTPWPRNPKTGTPRRAAVNSLGMGGTNVHVVLEEAPAAEPSGPSRPWQLLPLSARTPAALEAVTENLALHLESHPDGYSDTGLADAAYTLKVGRKPLAHRRCVVCRDAGEAVGLLRGDDPRRTFAAYAEGRERPVVFLFAGLGGQYVDMGRGLYRSEPVFRAEVDRAAELLMPHLGLDLRTVLYPEKAVRPETGERGPDLRRMLGRTPEKTAAKTEETDEASPLHETRLAQPALFVLEYALARLWMSWGVVPEAMLGYSIGEYVAACLSGVLTLEDALALVAGRARLIQELPQGAMLALGLAEADVLPLLGDELSLAAVNGPEQSVVAGPPEAIAALEAELERYLGGGLAGRRLQARHAFHSRMMAPLHAPLVALTAGVERRPPGIPYLSNVTGGWITDEEAVDPTYWARHAAGTVRFAAAVAELARVPDRILLEMGPGQTLGSLVLQHPDAPGRAGGSEPAVLASLPHSYERQPDPAFLLTSLGKLWLLGGRIDWDGFHDGERRRRVNLPTYPFERQRYWIETKRDVGSAQAAAAPAQPSTPATPAISAASAVSETPATSTTSEAVGFYPRPSLRVDYLAPRTELERSIAEAWRQLLGVAQVGVYDSFLDLGGDSLLASRLVVRLRDVVHLELPIRLVFEAPTVADLAAAVERLRAEAEEKEMQALLAQVKEMSDEDLDLEILRQEEMLRSDESR